MIMNRKRNRKALMTAALGAALFAAVLCPAALAEGTVSGTDSSLETLKTEATANVTDTRGRKGNAGEMNRNARAGKNSRGGHSDSRTRCGGQKETAEPENAIGQDAAISKVLAEAGITADQAENIRVHVSKNSAGTVVYKVCFSSSGLRCFGEVDAVTGEVLGSKDRNSTVPNSDLQDADTQSSDVQTENPAPVNQGHEGKHTKSGRTQSDTNL
jgi:uncharacterized membrane protein YkoI